MDDLDQNLAIMPSHSNEREFQHMNHLLINIYMFRVSYVQTQTVSSLNNTKYN